MVNRRISIMSIYMNYTLTLNVVKCITLFYSSLYRTWSIEGSLWTWWWQLPETRNTSSLFSSLHRTWGEYLLSNEHLGHVDNFFHTSSRREKLSTIVCFFCQPSLCLLYFWDKFQIQVTFRFRTSYRYWMYNLWFLNLLFVLIITLTSLILLCAEIICINIYIYIYFLCWQTPEVMYIYSFIVQAFVCIEMYISVLTVSWGSKSRAARYFGCRTQTEVRECCRLNRSITRKKRRRNNP